MATFAFIGNMRIGTKLGVAAGAGVVLVLAMAANQQRVHWLTQELNAQIRAADVVNNAVMEAELGLRRLVIQNRTVRAAHKVADVDTARKRLKELEGDTGKALDTAIASAASGDIRGKLNKAKTLYASYAAANIELADLRKDVLHLYEEQSKAGRGWPADLKSVIEHRAIEQAANRAELVRVLERIDYDFKQSRLLSWAKLVRPDDEIILKNTGVAFATTLKGLEEARGMDAAVKAGLEKLEAIVVQYQALVDKISATAAREGVLVREKVDPIRIEADKITDDVKQNVRKASLDAQAAAAAEETRTLWVNGAASAVILLVLIGAALFSLLNVARPIRRIGEVLIELANGNKAVEIPYAERGDEVGDNARAAKIFKDNLLRLEKLEAEQRAVEARATAQRKDEMEKLADGFQSAVGNIVEAVSAASVQLEQAAATLTGTAETTQKLAGVVTSASEEASTNVQSVASAAEEMTGSVDEIARQVQESSRIAGEAVSQAEKTDARITELSNAASRIGDVVKLITAIAEQTNLLALNATIEAARAGEAGRGFAVVAQEVKALASQTAKATDEIGTQIASMQAATRDSVTAIKEISGTIGRIAEIAAAIAAAVEEQGAATQEISRNVQQAAQGTAEVASNIVEVNRGANDTGSASAQVLGSAQSLARESHKLKHEVDRFLATVRAA